MLPEKPLFGFGSGTSSSVIDATYPLEHDIRFVHPPHNVVVLLALESGILSLLLFTLFLYDESKKNTLKRLLVLQIILLGSFDHYLITMPQTHFLMWLGLLAL